MKSFLKKHGGILYIAVITVVVVIVLACMEEPGQILETLRSLELLWVCAGAGCILLYLLLRAVTLRYYLSRRGYVLRWRNALDVTGSGQFYSAITPSASGGQPMQILALRRLGVPTSIATACVSAKFIGFQLAFLVIGGVLWLLNGGLVASQLFGFRWLVAMGYVVNAGLIVLIGLTVPKTRAVDALLRGAVAIGARLRLVKKPDAALESARGMLEDYREALVSLLRKPVDALVICGLSMLQVVSYMGVTGCIYLAFRLSGVRQDEIMTLQVLLFIAAAFVPLPGAAGAQESGFYLFFRGIFPESGVTAAMICWRFFTYYVLMIAGLIMMAVGSIGKGRAGRGEEKV